MQPKFEHIVTTQKVSTLSSEFFMERHDRRLVVIEKVDVSGEKCYRARTSMQMTRCSHPQCTYTLYSTRGLA